MNEVEELFGTLFSGKKNDKFGYHCTKCEYELDQVTVMKAPLRDHKKMFWCKNNKCERFGLVTVVAKKKVK